MPKNLFPILLALLFGVAIGVFSTIVLSDDAESLESSGDPSPNIEKSQAPAPTIEKSTDVAKGRDDAPTEKPKTEAVETPKHEISFDHLKAADGTISGRVFDMDGKPVSGAKIIALGGFHDGDLEAKINAASTREEHRAMLDQYNAALEAWQAVSRLETTSDTEGRYALKGLYKVGYLIEARVEGKEVISSSTSKLYPPATRDFFVATLHEIPVDVLMPDGSQAESASFSLSDPNQANRTFGRKAITSMGGLPFDYRAYRHDHFSPNPRDEFNLYSALKWSPDIPTIKLRSGVWPVRAYFESESGERYQSDVINVITLDDAPREKLIVQLKKLRTKRTNNASLSVKLDGKMRLMHSEYQFTFLPRFEDAPAASRPQRLSPTMIGHFAGFQAGRYEIQILRSGTVVASKVVEAKEGANSFEITVPKPDIRDFVVATVEDLPPHLRNALVFGFGIEFPKTEHQERPRRDGLVYFQKREVFWQEDGSVWIPLPPPEKCVIPEGARVYIKAFLHSGPVVVKFLPGFKHASVHLKLPKPGQLKISISNFDQRIPHHSNVSFRLELIELEDKEDLFGWDSYFHNVSQIDSRGVLIARDLEPGTYRLIPKVRGELSSNYRYASLATVRVKSGFNKVRVALPKFFQVKVLLPEGVIRGAAKGKNENVEIFLKDPNDPNESVFLSSSRLQVGESTPIGLLPAGEYTFRIMGKQMTLHVSEPGTITFVPTK